MTTEQPTILLDAGEMESAISRVAREVYESLPKDVPLAVIGIRSRGEILASRIVDHLRSFGADHIEVGTLDITLYRDDLETLGPEAVVRGTEITFDINGRYILLVDDVLHTGRSVRASMDALMDLGRPRAIRLLILVERPGRELPIQADFVGVTIPTEDLPVAVHLTESDGVDEVRLG